MHEKTLRTRENNLIIKGKCFYEIALFNDNFIKYILFIF